MKLKRNRVDWSKVKERLARNEHALDKALSAGPERIREVCRNRALEFASRKSRLVPAAPTRRVMLFTLADEQYAIELAAILGVRPFADCTPVPSAPPEVRGIVHLQGELRTVIDLRRLLDLPENETESRYILRVRRNDGEIGLAVDGVENVRNILESDLADPAALSSGIRADYVQGISSDGVIVLDADALFTHPLFVETESSSVETGADRS